MVTHDLCRHKWGRRMELLRGCYETLNTEIGAEKEVLRVVWHARTHGFDMLISEINLMKGKQAAERERGKGLTERERGRERL